MRKSVHIIKKHEGEKMRTKDELKRIACEAIDKRAEEIYAFAESVAKEPEFGFKEVKTAEKFANYLKELDYEPRTGVAITGVVAEKKGAKHNARVAVMGELDAILVAGHKDADPLTNAVHACGHNAQLAATLAVAMALHDTDIADDFGGDVVLMGVPAEECIEITYRKKLRDEGKLWFISGKQEFLRLGEFDNIDAAIMQHTAILNDEYKAGATSNNNGFTTKLVNYIGKEAHAGAAPHEGINALNAAMLGLLAVHTQRETFRDEDHIRIHPIITKGGDIVNVVPADVRIETYVRGSNTKAILDASAKMDRCLQSGALATGAECEIIEIPGYLPAVQCDPLNELMYENLTALLGDKAQLICSGFGGGSSDQGDVSSVIPSIQSYFTGAVGGLHSENYALVDKENAIITAAKALIMLTIDLLYDDASAASDIRKNFKPVFTKEAYLKEWGKIE